MLDVYVTEMPDADIGRPLLSETRMKSVMEKKHPRSRKESYYVWRLLEYAIERSLGISPADVDFSVTEKGKWCAEGFCFSLSHSYGMLAVAVSDFDCGVDIEAVRESPFATAIARKCFNADEVKRLGELDGVERLEYFVDRWSAKEALFKMGGVIPDSRKEKYYVITHRLKMPDRVFYLAVAGNVSDVKLHRAENIFEEIR